MRRFLTVLVLALAPAFAGGGASAQGFGGGAFEGMGDSTDPIQIEADRLEVMDGDGIAVFSGNVAVNQGTTQLKTDRLRVQYSRDGGGNAGPGGNVRTIEATGRVAVRSGDQFATAEKAVVNMESQIANLSGNVSVSQGNNIIEACVVTIDMRTNDIDVQPCPKKDGGTGRVKVLIDRTAGQ